MPVSLSPQQQAQVDSANAKLASAKSALDSATSSANDYLAALNRCYCGKGKKLGKCTPLTTTYTFPNLANISDCIESPNINKLVTDCGEQSTCKQKVTEYNDRVGIYNSAKDNFDTAQKNLKAILDAIAKDPTTGANASIINNEINAQKSKDMIKWLFFGLAAVIIIGGAIYIGIRSFRGRATA